MFGNKLHGPLSRDILEFVPCSATLFAVIPDSVHALFSEPTIPLNKEAAESNMVL